MCGEVCFVRGWGWGVVLPAGQSFILAPVILYHLIPSSQRLLSTPPSVTLPLSVDLYIHPSLPTQVPCPTHHPLVHLRVLRDDGISTLRCSVMVENQSVFS